MKNRNKYSTKTFSKSIKTATNRKIDKIRVKVGNVNLKRQVTFTENAFNVPSAATRTERVHKVQCRNQVRVTDIVSLETIKARLQPNTFRLIDESNNRGEKRNIRNRLKLKVGNLRQIFNVPSAATKLTGVQVALVQYCQ